MEGFKGTPGPWRYSTQFGAVTVSKPGILEGDKTICDINYNVPTERVPEMDANAALITVAPELLECLHEFVTSYYNKNVAEMEVLRLKSEAIVNKALGK